MKKRISLLIFWGMLVCTLVATAQMKVSSLSADDRLPKDIKEVFVDSEGFLWYVTDGGLYQDDGYHTTCYRADIHRPDLMKSNHTTCVAEDTQGRIWIGTRRGAYMLDKQTYELATLSEPEVVDHVINTINVTSDGQLWLSTNEHLLRYDSCGHLVARYPILHKVQQLYEDSRGDIWRILWRDGLARYDAVQDSFLTIDWPFLEHPAYMIEDRETGSYWVSVWERGIVRYTPQTDSLNRFVWQRVTRRASPVLERKLSKLNPWMDGQYLCGLQEGGRLQLFEVTMADSLRRIVGDEADSLIPCGVNQEYVHVRVDTDDRLWLTGINSDVLTVNKQHVAVSGLRYTNKARPVFLIAEDGGCWLQDGFTRKYIYWRMSDGKQTRLPNPDKIIAMQQARSQSGIYTIRKYNDLVRFYMENGRLKTERMFTYSLSDDERVRTFYEDETGRFWLGTNKRLMFYDTVSATLLPVDGVQGLVLSITSDKQGRVYAITEGRRMFRIALNGKIQTFTLHEDFSRLTHSQTGEVWGVTQQGSVCLFDSAKDEFIPFTYELGLTGETVVDIHFDVHNRLWVLYSNQLIVYNPHKKDEMPRFVSATSSLLEMESLWSLHRSKSGDMYVGGTNGIAVFDSTCLASAEVEVPLRLIAVCMGDVRRMVPFVDKTASEFRLDASDSDVQLFFSTLISSDASQVRMAWRYRGRNRWILLAGGENTIHLTDLKRGNHQIEVRATTPEGVWGNNSLVMNVYRPWPWYFSMWARVSYFLVVCVLIAWGIIRLRRSIESHKQRVATQLYDDTASVENNPTEEERFMLQVKEMIEKNLANADYSVEELSSDMAMSRASLHRKMKAISGQTPTELMRIHRLNRAAELLKEGRLNVNEVAYTVGFSTPSYFTQLFKKHFGVLPSEYEGTSK